MRKSRWSGTASIVALAIAISAPARGATGAGRSADAPESATAVEATMANPPPGREYKGKLDPIGPFKLRDLEGRLWSDRDFNGRFLIVVQWAAWCGPCISEFPQVQKLYDALRDDPSIRLISVDLDEDPATIADFLKEFRKEYTFPVLLGWSRFKIKALPSTWIVDREGYIREFQRGSGTGWIEHIRTLLDTVMREPPVTSLPPEVREAQRKQNELDGVKTR